MFSGLVGLTVGSIKDAEELGASDKTYVYDARLVGMCLADLYSKGGNESHDTF